MDITTYSRQLSALVQTANRIVIATHQRPDSDALGSMVAVSQWLSSLGKEHMQFCMHQAPDTLEWLTWYDPITNDLEVVREWNADLYIVLDCGDLKHPGLDEFIASLPIHPRIINIDHHATNKQFGEHNIVLTDTASTTEILYQLFTELEIQITPRMASALLAGILGDTYNFTNPNTTQDSMHIASELLKHGASLPKVSEAIFNNKSLSTLQAWGKLLTQALYVPEWELAVVVINAADLEADQLIASEVSDGMANFLNNLTGVSAALIVHQQTNGFIKGSLRTNSDLIDVSKLATMLGGGGHKKAAGFQFQGQLVKVENGWKVE